MLETLGNHLNKEAENRVSLKRTPGLDDKWAAGWWRHEHREEAHLREKTFGSEKLGPRR